MPQWVRLSEWLGIWFERGLVRLNCRQERLSSFEAFWRPVFFAIIVLINYGRTTVEIDPGLL